MDDKILINHTGKPIKTDNPSIASVVKFIEAHWFIFTGVITAAVTVVSFLFSLYRLSKADYLNISSDWIKINNEMIVFDIIKYLFVSVIYLLINYLPYNLIMSQKRRKWQVLSSFLWTFLFLLATSLCLLLIGLIQVGWPEYLITASNIGEIVYSFVVFFIFSTILWLPGILGGFAKFLNNLNNRISKKLDKVFAVIDRRKALSFVVIIAIYIAFMCGIVYYLGRVQATNENKYKTTENYVVLGEKDNQLLCSPIIRKSKTELIFDSREQVIISSENVLIKIDEYQKVLTNGTEEQSGKRGVI